MKKKLISVLIVIVIIVGAIFAWRVAYTMQKSTDNLPTLEAIAGMSESEINSLLPGYKINQLKAVWGDPDSGEDGTVNWKIGSITLIVNYKNNGVIVICALKDGSGVSVGE